MEEVWKQVKDYPDYLVSDSGRICSLKSGLLKPSENSRGYMLVTLNGENKRLHRIVAMSFIPNPENKDQVNHIDGNPKNNKVSNLEWSTNSENQKHRYSELKKSNKSKAVEKIMGEEIVATFESIRECERMEKMPEDSLRDVIRKHICRNGFYYQYKELKSGNN